MHASSSVPAELSTAPNVEPVRPTQDSHFVLMFNVWRFKFQEMPITIHRVCNTKRLQYHTAAQCFHYTPQMLSALCLSQEQTCV